MTNELSKKESGRPAAAQQERRRLITPDVDILENGNDILLIADVPGVDDKNLDVEVENRVLTIRGRTGELEPSQHRLVAGDYTPSDFERVFTLSEEIDQDKIEASVKNGVLRLRLPKAGPARARKISVQTQ